MLNFIIENSANQLTFINFAESVSIYVSSPVGIPEAEGETFTTPLSDHVQPEVEGERGHGHDGHQVEGHPRPELARGRRHLHRGGY